VEETRRVIRVGESLKPRRGHSGKRIDLRWGSKG
jgi:hypothetical protein